MLGGAGSGGSDVALCMAAVKRRVIRPCCVWPGSRRGPFRGSLGSIWGTPLLTESPRARPWKMYPEYPMAVDTTSRWVSGEGTRFRGPSWNGQAECDSSLKTIPSSHSTLDRSREFPSPATALGQGPRREVYGAVAPCSPRSLYGGGFGPGRPLPDSESGPRRPDPPASRRDPMPRWRVVLLRLILEVQAPGDRVERTRRVETPPTRSTRGPLTRLGVWGDPPTPTPSRSARSSAHEVGSNGASSAA